MTGRTQDTLTPRTWYAAAAIAVVGVASCSGGPINNGGANNAQQLVDGASSQQCRLQVDAVSKTKADVGGKLDYALVEVQGSASYDNFQEVKAGFDELQKDFDLVSYKLCEDAANGRVSQDYYQKRRTCMDNALVAMRVMEKDLGSLEKDDADEEEAWALESKLAWIREAILCKDEAASAPINAPPRSQGGGAGSGEAEEVNLTTYLVCQRKEGGKYVDVPECDGAELKTDDRVRFGFKTEQPARIYILAHNSTGQFQMLFPDPGVDNESVPGAETFIPADDWFYLDDEVKDVTEIVQVVAAKWKVPQLEAFRGKEFPPREDADTGKKRPSPQAMKSRGLIEPVIRRGFTRKKKGGPRSQSKPVQMSVGGSDVNTVPMSNSYPGAAAIEFRIVHK